MLDTLSEVDRVGARYGDAMRQPFHYCGIPSGRVAFTREVAKAQIILRYTCGKKRRHFV